jgi:hypothetical protein
MDVTAAAVLDAGSVSLQEAVTSCTWRIELSGIDEPEAAERARETLGAPALWLERTRKGDAFTDDVRAAVLGLDVVSLGVGERDHDGAVLVAELGTQPRALRPSELLQVMWPHLATESLPPADGAPSWVPNVRRLHQWIERDGARYEPLPDGRPAVATSPRHTIESVCP